MDWPARDYDAFYQITPLEKRKLRSARALFAAMLGAFVYRQFPLYMSAQIVYGKTVHM